MFSLNKWFWAITYLFIFEILLKTTLRFCFSTFTPTLWKNLASKPAHFCKNEQQETILMLSIGSQHVLAGFMILRGRFNNNPFLVRHGICCESGWEMLDAFFLMFRLGAYKGDTVKKELRNVMIWHHIPGIICSLPLIVSGLETNIHVQNVAACMILVGGIGVLTNSFMFILDSIGATNTMLVLLIVEDLVFVVARFVIFPMESYNLIMAVVDGHSSIVYVVSLGVVFMSFFNFVILSIKIKKLVGALKAFSSGSTKKKKLLLARQSSSTSWIVAGVDDTVNLDEEEEERKKQ